MDWSNCQIYCVPPRKLYFETLKKIEATTAVRGCLVLLENNENILGRTWLSHDCHMPPFVLNIYKRVIKVHSPSFCNKFIREDHDCLLIFFDTSLSNTNLATRCSKLPGDCEICEGNKFMVPQRTVYHQRLFRNDDCIFKF